jgi:uncharacterized delta-60 repeat protein
MQQESRSNHARRETRRAALFIPLLFVFILPRVALAAPGGLDAGPGGFSANGVANTQMGSTSNNDDASAQSVAIQADGKVVVAGGVGGGTTQRFALARYKVNGNLDQTFHGDGKVHTLFGSLSGATSVAIQTNQKIVAAGWMVSGNQTHFAIARYKTNGNLDTSFGPNGDGKVITHIGANSGATSIAIQNTDQKIVVAGSARVGNSEGFALARYGTNGILDGTFGSNANGKVHTPIGIYAQGDAVAIQPDQKIVVAGTASTTPNNAKFALARYDTGGVLDGSFGGGTITTTFGTPSIAGANSVAIQGDLKIVAAGYSGSGSNMRFAITRYDPTTGLLDASFANNGRLNINMGPYSEAAAVVIQPDQKIVIAGRADQANTGVFAIARWDPVTGLLDSGFDTDGKVTTLIANASGATAMAIQPSDGKLVVAGDASFANSYRFAVARYQD